MNDFNFAKVLKTPRKIRMYYYQLWNTLCLKINGVKTGKNVRVYNKLHLKIHPMAKVVLGNNVSIVCGDNYNPLCRNIDGSLCAEYPDSIIEIGEESGLSSPCIWAKKQITIGKRVKIGGDCILLDSDCHSLDWRQRCLSEDKSEGLPVDTLNAKISPIIIGDDVFIGTRSIILKGVRIGERSIIAAGSVVTKNIPSDCIAAGNPAIVIRKINENI